MLDFLMRMLLKPEPYRVLIARKLFERFPIEDVDLEVKLAIGHRPEYLYGVYHAADLACRLGHTRMSVFEFGVAGGNGLIALERIVRKVEKRFPIAIEIYGFDTGQGLPPPEGIRDLPYIWQERQFAMDRKQLEDRLERATLVMGNVAQTCGTFFADRQVAPVGFVAFDLDYYSSTRDALRLFSEAPRTALLPRVFCYFDDLISSDQGHVGEHAGVPLAITEYNQSRDDRKLVKLGHLAHAFPSARPWHAKYFVHHDFDNPEYGTYIAAPDRQLPLRAS